MKNNNTIIPKEILTDKQAEVRKNNREKLVELSNPRHEPVETTSHPLEWYGLNDDGKKLINRYSPMRNTTKIKIGNPQENDVDILEITLPTGMKLSINTAWDYDDLGNEWSIKTDLSLTGKHGRGRAFIGSINEGHDAGHDDGEFGSFRTYVENHKETVYGKIMVGEVYNLKEDRIISHFFEGKTVSPAKK